MRSIRKFVVAFVILVACMTYAVAGPSKEADVDTAVEPTHVGKAVGRVYDAFSGAPLANAVVSIQQDGVFPTDGAASGTTDATGKYQCETKLGRISKSFDVGRALNSSLIGMVFSGSAMKVTKRVDVSRLTMRVTCDGYRLFEGIAPCRQIDVEKFTANMEPILLTPVTSQEVSAVAPGWGIAQLLDVTIEPTITHPRDEVIVTGHVKCPALPKSAKMGLHLNSGILGSKTLTSMTTAQDGVLTFSSKFTISKKAKTNSEVVTLSLDGCPYDILSGKETQSILLQVVQTTDEEAAARIRSDAYRLEQQGDYTRALARLKELCALPSSTIADNQRLAEIAGHEHDQAMVVTAYQKIVELTPEKERMWPCATYANALLAAGQSERIITEMVPVVEKVKEKDRPKRVPSLLMTAIGMAYTDLKKFSEAGSISKALEKWPDASSNPMVAHFRQSLDLAQAQQAVHAAPTDAQSWATYGRKLLDAGRTEEAIEKLKKAVSLDSTLTSAKDDLQSAQTRVQAQTASTPKDIDAEISSIEQSIGDGKTNKDFFVWHRYALLLLRKGWQQQQTNEQMAISTFSKTQEVITEALKCGRSGKDTLSEGNSYGIFGYYGSKVVGISGFAYPEGNADFVLLQSLHVIEKQPKDYLAYLGMAMALLELKQTDIAGTVLQKCLALKPECTEAIYASGLVAMQQGKRSIAIARFNEVLKANPRHTGAKAFLNELGATVPKPDAGTSVAPKLPPTTQSPVEVVPKTQPQENPPDTPAAKTTSPDKVETPAPGTTSPNIAATPPTQQTTPTSTDKVSQPTTPDQPQAVKEWPPLLCIKDKTMVPLRAFAIWLGAETTFDSRANVYTITKNNQIVSLHFGDTAATVNGKLVATSSPTREINGVGYGQFTFLADAFALKYSFDPKANVLTITDLGTNNTVALQVKYYQEKK